VLGFEDLRGYLQARCDAGHSVPRIATELGVRDWQVHAALTRLAVPLAARPQRLAAQRRRYTEERIAARVARLGFADVGAYLVDRVVERAWLLAEVAAELAAHRVTVRRLLERHGIRRVRRTPKERAAADSGRRGVGGGVTGTSGGAAGGAGFRGPGGIPAGAARRAGVVDQADAGRAWGRPQVAGRGTGPAGVAILTVGSAAPMLGERGPRSRCGKGLLSASSSWFTGWSPW
jgi:hypothetical protein